MLPTVSPSLAVFPERFAYVAVFGLAALACFASATRARRISDPDTSRGLVWLLVTSGAWASTHVGFFLAPADALRVGFYSAGLIVGLAAVGFWLYFCSAYTGRTLHRNQPVRRLAALAFLAIVAVKVTNPIHHYYFTTTTVREPFLHLAVEHGILHWLVMGASYSLAIVGYFMLYERLTRVSADARPLLVLVTITGLPIVLDVIGFSTPLLVDVTYEPIGVAIFAVGVMFVYEERFQRVRLADRRNQPVLVLDAENRIRDVNAAARERFPELDLLDALGKPLRSVLPQVADATDYSDEILSVDVDGDTRYYHVSQSPFAAGQRELGQVIVLDDVTDRERYRRELERQNERLEQFASMVSHDLRNPLNVAEGHLEIARETRDDDHLEAAADALDRMEELIEDVLDLARQGQPIDETAPVSIEAVVEACWAVVATGEATLETTGDLRFRADPDRLRQLLENLLRNAIEHGGSDVRLTAGPLEEGPGFYVADDGPGIPPEAGEDVFESGYTTNPGGTGFGLAIVGEIVDAHGWDIRVTESEGGGARFEVSGVDVVE